MPSITLQEALSVAEAIDPPYTGDKADASKVKSFLQSNADKIRVTGSDGLAVDLKSIEVEAPAPSVKSLTLPARAAAAAGTTASVLPADLDLKVKAMAEQAFKNAAAELKAQRPGGLPETKAGDIGTVKSGEEVRYERKMRDGNAVFGDYADAKGFAHYLAARTAVKMGRLSDYERHQKAYLKFCETKGYVTTSVASGGALVPDQYDARLIQLIKDYGVARKVCTVINMESDTVTRPRVTGELTVYYPAEGSAGTESTRTWSDVQLRAKQGIVLVKMSTAIVADAAIDIAEDSARSAARAIAAIEDQTLFNGDGSNNGTYIPGCRGIVYNFGTSATTDSRSNTGGDTSDAHTRANLIVAMGKCPRFVGGMPGWHLSYEMGSILLGLALAQGAANTQDFAGLGTLDTAFNRPIFYNNVMNLNFNTGADTVDMLFGDISQAAYLGLRGGIQIDTSTERYFDEANIALRAIVRHDLTVHDMGSTTTQSPVVALYQT